MTRCFSCGTNRNVYRGLCDKCRSDVDRCRDGFEPMDEPDVDLVYLTNAARANASRPLGYALLIAAQKVDEDGSEYGW